MNITKLSVIRHTILFAIFFLILVGCVAQQDERSTINSNPASTEGVSVSTATIEWFPATATPTATSLPLPTATTTYLEGLSDFVQVDPFSDPKQWSNISDGASDSPNQALFSNQALVFAINQSPARFVSINQGMILADSAITVRININRCSPADTYGLLFKANTEQIANRLNLRCDGQLRVEQLRDNSIHPLTEWLPSGDVPQGGPSNVVVTIWTAGNETRIFLNNHYQVSIFDRYYPTGSVGFFANAQGDLGLNVQFSELMIQHVDYVSPTPTPTSSSQGKATSTPTNTP